jgi:hypothetical protein
MVKLHVHVFFMWFVAKKFDILHPHEWSKLALLAKFPNKLQLKNVLTCISFKVSAKEIVGLLQWNTGKYIRCAEFHITKLLRTYTKPSGTLVHSHEGILNKNFVGKEIF